MKPFLLFLTLTPTWGLDPPFQQVPVEISHEKGNFSGQLSIAVSGPMSKAKLTWAATIRNKSLTKTFRVTFCVKAFDDSGQQTNPGGDECILRLFGSNWDSDVTLTFKGNQNIKFSDDKALVHVSKWTVTATDVFNHSPNLRYLDVRCQLVWPSAIRVFADKKFRPTVMDKESFTATYTYDGGRIDGYDSKKMLRAYTTANTALLGPVWESFRVDSASLYLREEKPGSCTAELKMSFAGFGKPMLGRLGWYVAESNFNFEKVLLDSLVTQSQLAASSDLDKAINLLPNQATNPAENTAKPQLTITSEPAGAEIAIDGEFIGNTPTTVSAKEGSVNVRLRKAGYQTWERSLKLNSGDKRTLNAEMVK